MFHEASRRAGREAKPRRSRLPRVAKLAVSILILSVVADAAAAAGVEYVFSSQPSDTRVWLSGHGFQFKLDASDASRARFGLSERGLSIETLARAEPLLAHDGINVAQPAELAVQWGVDRYPVGANWDVGVNNEPIMVMVQFGRQKFSGGLFLPAMPYFIGFFLCNAGHRGVDITGRSYRAQGRYICLDGPPPGKQITSITNLDEHFRKAFGGATAAPVTGFAIEADTTQVPSDGGSAAWIKSIGIQTKQ